MSIVGLYLSSLTSLDFSYCPQVTDGGLLTLVLPQDHTGLSDNRYSTHVQMYTGTVHKTGPCRFGQCQALTRLLVSGCQSVTSNSAGQLLVSLVTIDQLEARILTIDQSEAEADCVRLR